MSNPNEVRDRESMAYGADRTYHILSTSERMMWELAYAQAHRDGWQAALAKDPRVLNLIKAAERFKNLECDYQSEDTSGLRYSVQYWIEEKARRKVKLEEALAAFEEKA